MSKKSDVKNKSEEKNPISSEKNGSGKTGKVLNEILEWLEVIVAAAVIAFCINTFLIANSVIPTSSMETTIMAGDRVMGSRLSYRFGKDPQRGDVIIFRWPVDEKTYFVKRIIGLPGETVDIHDGGVYINGSETPLDEPYLKEAMDTPVHMTFQVPEDGYFCMGDNRNNSLDARYWYMMAREQDNFDEKKDYTYIHRDKIIAKVLFRYWKGFKMIK